MLHRVSKKENSSWVSYLDLGNVDAGSALRQLGAVLALSAVVAATHIASAQPFDPVARDIRTGVYRGHAVTYEVVDGLAIWDGDIILGTPEELSPDPSPTPGNTPDYRNKISTTSSKEKLWPGGIVPYVLDPELTNQFVHDAIRHWNENTVIQLVERTDQPNWVRFMPGRGCSASVGMIGGEQIITLSENCGRGAGVHEIGHAVGLWHEHERSDRDSHVWARSHPLGIVDGSFYYGKDGPYAVASGPYDYGSVMHYRKIGAVETIPPGIDLGRGGPQLGGSSDTGLSAGDIDGVNRLYGTIPTKTTVSANVAGLLIEVDGETYTAPHSFDWELGSMHTIGVVSPQKDVRGIDYIRYLFAKWSDGGAQTHSVTASSETTVFIANFIEQYRPEPIAEPPHGGTVKFDPPSADGFYPRFSYVKAFAEPAEGFSFEHWRRRAFFLYSGGHSSSPVLFRALQRYPALFTQQPLTTIDTNVPGSSVLVDGEPTRLPINFAWEAGSTHTLGFGGTIGLAQSPIGVPYRVTFDGWSDGGDATHDITVSAEPATITANFARRVGVNTVTHGPGWIEVQPSGSAGRYYEPSTMAQLTARPASGFKFVSWSVDLSGTENPQSLLMDTHKWVRAYFLDENTFESARLTSGKPFPLLFGPGAARTDGYWIYVPRGGTQLDIRLVTSTPGAEVDLYANRDIRPNAVLDENTKKPVGYESQYSATGPGGDETISITPASSHPLEPGLYFIAVHVRTQGVSVQGSLTAEVTAAESVISANIPHFGIPASVITTREGEAPAPQVLEIRNSGRGTLDYEIATDQPWLSVWPDQGSSVGETDTVEIIVDPTNLEPVAYEGTITITEQQPAGGFFSLFSKSSPPAWPVTVPVTLIIIPEGWEDPTDTTPTIPDHEEHEEHEEDEEDEEEPSEPTDTISSLPGDGGPAVEAKLAWPTGVAVDAAGNLYIADPEDQRIRRVDPSGAISTFAGTGERGFDGDGGTALLARFSSPTDVEVDTAGNLYIADSSNHRIRKVDPSGIITTIAGTDERGFDGDGGPAVEARLHLPRDVAVDAAGNLFIADASNHRIRRVDPSGIISTVAGTGERGFSVGYGPAVQAMLSFLTGVAVDTAGNLYIADYENRRVRKVDPSGIITTFAGTGEADFFIQEGGQAVQATLSLPHGVAVDSSGNVFIADSGNARIHRVDPSGIITTVAGTNVQGFTGDGGPATLARVYVPSGVAVDAAGNLFIADTGNRRIRKVDTSGTITTVAGSGEVEQ